jgi:hypothetical protein
MFFTGISDNNIYNDNMDITPPPGTLDEPDITFLSDPPTPEALHDVLTLLELEQHGWSGVALNLSRRNSKSRQHGGSRGDGICAQSVSAGA